MLTRQQSLALQDISALTLARDLHDLRLAQRSGAHSPRLPGVGPPLRECSGRTFWWPYVRAASGGNQMPAGRLTTQGGTA